MYASHYELEQRVKEKYQTAVKKGIEKERTATALNDKRTAERTARVAVTPLSRRNGCRC